MKLVRVAVKVMPRAEILDTQGRTVGKALQDEGFKLSSCTIGKWIELEVEASDEKTATDKAKKMAEFVLYNPLIETFEVKVFPS